MQISLADADFLGVSGSLVLLRDRSRQREGYRNDVRGGLRLGNRRESRLRASSFALHATEDKPRFGEAGSGYSSA